MTTENGPAIADGLQYAAKVGPGLGVTGTMFMGLPLAEWVYIVTIGYTLLQTAHFIWKLVSREKQTLIKKIEDAENGG